MKPVLIIDMSTWKEYQPKREREKTFHDIKLRDGTVIACCWPNADAWTPLEGRHAGKTIKDYRVVAIRTCHHPMDEPDFKKGDRVKVCDNPQCGHHGDITGTVDIVGYFADSPEPDVEMMTIVRDGGGGVVGPFRLHEVTKL